jgi:hypothetical protein
MLKNKYTLFYIGTLCTYLAIRELPSQASGAKSKTGLIFNICTIITILYR